jgi:purine-binding chemotaxis protein CheW
MVNSQKTLIVFSLEGRRYALYLVAVERAVRVVDVVPLPKAPETILGVINVGGEIMPVFNVRKRFGFPSREMDLSDHLIIARTSRRRVALWVDAVMEILNQEEAQIVEAQKIVAGMEYVAGVVKLKDGLILIHDLERFLSLDEQEVLEQAMQEDSRGG